MATADAAQWINRRCNRVGVYWIITGPFDRRRSYFLPMITCQTISFFLSSVNTEAVVTCKSVQRRPAENFQSTRWRTRCPDRKSIWECIYRPGREGSVEGASFIGNGNQNRKSGEKEWGPQKKERNRMAIALLAQHKRKISSRLLTESGIAVDGRPPGRRGLNGGHFYV